jgi:hypothetical protein
MCPSTAAEEPGLFSFLVPLRLLSTLIPADGPIHPPEKPVTTPRRLSCGRILLEPGTQPIIEAPLLTISPQIYSLPQKANSYRFSVGIFTTTLDTLVGRFQHSVGWRRPGVHVWAEIDGKELLLKLAAAGLE